MEDRARLLARVEGAMRSKLAADEHFEDEVKAAAQQGLSEREMADFLTRRVKKIGSSTIGDLKKRASARTAEAVD